MTHVYICNNVTLTSVQISQPRLDLMMSDLWSYFCDLWLMAYFVLETIVFGLMI